MIVAFGVVAVSPTLLVLQTVQVVRRVAQYAIARPSREMIFTVVPQEGRYKAKNVIDTVVYRGGDVAAAWMQAGLRAFGAGLGGVVAVGLASNAVGTVNPVRTIADLAHMAGNLVPWVAGQGG